MNRLLLIVAYIVVVSVGVIAESNQGDIESARLKYVSELSSHHYELMKSAERALIVQQVQTIVIAVMVFIMVGVGLRLSYLQFKRDETSEARSVTTLRVGSGSVEITSSVIGLIILIVSLWFFQTYVNRVYALEDLLIPPIDFAETPTEPPNTRITDVEIPAEIPTVKIPEGTLKMLEASD